MVRRSSMNPGYTGYPARIFYEMTIYGHGPQLLSEKMVILEKWYSHLRAYVPMMFKDKISGYTDKNFMLIDEKGEPHQVSLYDLINDAAKNIDGMENDYQAVFEGQGCTGEEKKFMQKMRGVFERLDYITSCAEIIDKVQIMDEMIV